VYTVDFVDLAWPVTNSEVWTQVNRSGDDNQQK